MHYKLITYSASPSLTIIGEPFWFSLLSSDSSKYQTFRNVFDDAYRVREPDQALEKMEVNLGKRWTEIRQTFSSLPIHPDRMRVDLDEEKEKEKKVHNAIVLQTCMELISFTHSSYTFFTQCEAVLCIQLLMERDRRLIIYFASLRTFKKIQAFQMRLDGVDDLYTLNRTKFTQLRSGETMREILDKTFQMLDFCGIESMRAKFQKEGPEYWVQLLETYL